MPFASLAALAVAPLLAAPGDVPCDVQLSVTPNPVPPGFPVEITVVGEAGLPGCLLVDTVCEPTVVPGLDLVVGVGLSPEFFILHLPVMTAGGVTLPAEVECGSALEGSLLCLQAVLVDPETLEICLSPVVEVVVEGSSSACPGEGCTPGYWKQDQHFDSWAPPYTPTTAFSAVFEDAFPGLTLLDVLAQGGGGLNALGRHTVAALLNAAAGVAYPLSVDEVVQAFDDVFPGGAYEDLKNELEGFNEAGCPLN